MPRIIAVHRITLKDGVTPEEFESFARNEWKPVEIPGWRMSVAKSDRGDDVGTFVQIYETDLATRNRHFPTGQMSDEARALYERASNTPERKALIERWDALVVQPTDLTRSYNDFIVITG